MTTGIPDPPAPPLAPLAARLSPLSLSAMLLLALLWGLSIPITKLGLESMPPMTLTALRFGFAVPFLFTLGRHRIPLGALPRLAALGLLGIGVGNVSQTFGIAGTSASVGTIISATIPVFIVLFAALRLGQAVTWLQQLGLAAAFGGIALVAFGQGDGVDDLAQTTLRGAALVLLSAVTIAFYYVWSVELTARYGTVTVVAWSTLAGFVALLPFTAWRSGAHLSASSPWPSQRRPIWGFWFPPRACSCGCGCCNPFPLALRRACSSCNLSLASRHRQRCSAAGWARSSRPGSSWSWPVWEPR